MLHVIVDFQVVWSTLGKDINKSRLIRFAVNDWDSISKDEQMVVHSFLTSLITHFTSALVQQDKLPDLKTVLSGWEDNIMGSCSVPVVGNGTRHVAICGFPKFEKE